LASHGTARSEGKQPSGRCTPVAMAMQACWQAGERPCLSTSGFLRKPRLADIEVVGERFCGIDVQVAHDDVHMGLSNR